MRNFAKRWLIPMLFLTVLAAGSAGCASTTLRQREQYESMKASGIPVDEPYDPTTAALLNLICVGDIYNGQWGAFALDLIFWPLSIVWAVPQGYITAENQNIHYNLDGKGYDSER